MKMLNFAIDGINTAAVAELIGDDPVLFSSLLEIFVEENSSLVSRLEGLCDDRQSKQAAVLAHKLRGQAGSIGAEQLQQLAAALEEALLAGDTDTLLLCSELEQLLHTLLAAIERWQQAHNKTVQTEQAVAPVCDLSSAIPLVLIVDDDAVMRDLSGSILADAGYRICLAKDALSGLHLARQRQPDLILLDYVMPGMSGSELLKELKADPLTAEISVLMMTISDAVAIESDCLELGAADFVRKPVNATVLKARVSLQLALQEKEARLHQLIAELQAEKSKLEYVSCHDPLTDLYNRSMMKEVINAEFSAAQRHHKQVALVMLDIDHFKQINDQHGHQTGDEVLVAVARLIRQRLRQSDMGYRYGGEEFLLLLPDTSLADAGRLAESLLTMIRTSDVAVLQSCKVTASAGGASFAASDSHYEEALSRADQALYQSKHNGRNRVTLSPV